MYLPPHFEERRTEVMHALVRAQPLATLVTLSARGLEANHIPFVLSSGEGPLGTLRGHVARANPLWRDLVADVEALAVFHGPDAYITPSWYATKQDGGRVVPTWNYAVVHAHGRLRAVQDSEWLRTQLEALTEHNEAAFHEQWKVGDAPRDYIDKLMAGIVGIELVITRLEGKWKVSQNQPVENRAGVADGLTALGTDKAAAMARLVAAARKDLG